MTGRPHKYGEPMTRRSVWLPDSMWPVIDDLAQERAMNRSEFIVKVLKVEIGSGSIHFAAISVLETKNKKLRELLAYVRDVRDIQCVHTHAGPDEVCAKCLIDDAVSDY